MRGNAVKRNFVNKTNNHELRLKNKPIKLVPRPFVADQQGVPIGLKLLRKQRKHADNVRANPQNPKPG
jgi:hypothetical protein